MDLKALIDAAIPSTNNLLLIAVAAFGLAFFWSKLGQRVLHTAGQALFSNWQLTLLASTGIVLSLASGYTTFDGLRNFTRAPLLSVMISFGIQGVMLIVAWLIGESFAAGMNRRLEGGRSGQRVDPILGMVLAFLLIGAVFYWMLYQFDAVSWTKTANLEFDWIRFANVSMYYLLGLIILALIAFNFRSGGELSIPYVQSMRVILRNAVLWVMFLASMAASVFFSFDSHFNAIFSQEERKRAAEIRSVAQIGAVVSDIGSISQKRQIEEAESLFNADGWKAYDKQLTVLAHQAQGAQAEIEKFFVQQMEERRRAVNQQQERISTAQSGQVGLANKKISLTEELSRLKAERPALAAEYAEHKSELDTKAKEIDAKRVEALAEDRGVEGTLKQGRGPVYRQRMSEVGTLQDQYKIKQERTGNAQKRLVSVETRISQIERELSTIDGDLAKYKGEAQTAEQRIKTMLAVNTDEEGTKLDPARVLPAFERARGSFRQQPSAERLAVLQLQCTNLLNAMSSTPVTKEKVRAIDCDPKQAAEAANRVFALNAGLEAFHNTCAGGDKLARYTTTDALLGFGRQCLQDSGLISKDSVDIGARLSSIDMNRDDKAHRFVVTWNAFLDGNRLAYLSLILAIGVDALVFMSGLFGAQALRSPLTDVPSEKARSAHQLEGIIEAALQPDTFKKARLARAAMHPMSGENFQGYTHEVHLGRLDPETATHVRDVLNAGATIGAVRHSAGSDRFLVRGELYEFLCEIMRREFRRRPEEVKLERDMHELETRLAEALVPNEGEAANAVLHYLHPIDEQHGFTSEIFLGEVESQHLRPVRNVLTAGSSLRVVQRDQGDRNRYYVHSDLYKTLARIRARSYMSDDRGLVWGGRLNPIDALEADVPPRLITNGRSGDQANGSTNAELRERFEQALLNAMGLRPESLRKLAGEIGRQAQSAASALRQRAHRHAGLNEVLRLAESQNHQKLEWVKKTLSETVKDKPQAERVLEETFLEIKKLVPALLLLPEGGLVTQLVAELQEAEAANGLRADERNLLDGLLLLEKELGSMDPSDQVGWRRITRQLEHLNDLGPASLLSAALNGGTSTKH